LNKICELESFSLAIRRTIPVGDFNKMARIKFRKGQQRKFLQKVLNNVNSPSLRELANRMEINYSSLKNYYSELRLLPDDIFKNLCFLGKISFQELNFERVEESWGQIMGGKKSKKG